jgi:hypothetical protein
MKKHLLELLTSLNAETEKSTVADVFEKIATELMCNYQIKSVSGKTYNIHEIEFYFLNKNHKDTSVHRHNMDAGHWRVHYSGIDITFNGCKKMNDDCKNKKCIDCADLSSYGGILIRSIGYKEELKEKLIVGPLRVQTTLLTGGSISGSEGISLIENNGCNTIISKTSKRCGINNANGFEVKEYCYFNEKKIKR